MVSIDMGSYWGLHDGPYLEARLKESNLLGLVLTKKLLVPQTPKIIGFLFGNQYQHRFLNQVPTLASSSLLQHGRFYPISQTCLWELTRPRDSRMKVTAEPMSFWSPVKKNELTGTTLVSIRAHLKGPESFLVQASKRTTRVPASFLKSK